MRNCFPQVAQIYAEDAELFPADRAEHAAFVFLPAWHFCLKAQTYAEGFSA